MYIFKEKSPVVKTPFLLLAWDLSDNLATGADFIVFYPKKILPHLFQRLLVVVSLSC